ncbi:hypothetical protein [Chlorobaculum tepidum]|jgi:hypothetical protein|uniref:hypothetical protein n=1 Tax=Chlorobaculum tepidum TaxID=1097 RepID=UPI0013E8B5BF|nr:hypothetical protein [Chlorobaculum tepidum]
MDLLVVLAIVLGVAAIFVLLHLRPLTDDEVRVLADRRRTKTINSYYTFDRKEYSVSAEFKKRMAANGSFYNISERLFEFPALAAGLLKYKKHEWIIVAFERNKVIAKMWVNKGPDRSQVHFGISLPSVQQIAANGNYRSVLVFHNHPNSDPSLYSTRQASDRDKQTAGELAAQLRSAGVNLIEFVCERGRHYEYWRSVCDTFLPLEGFREEICKVNGSSRGQNFSLHWERLFG